MANDPPEPPDPTRMTLGEHLAELRRRLIRGMAALGIAFVLGWTFYEEATDVMLEPMHKAVQRVDHDQVEKYEKKLVDEPGHKRSDFFQSDDPANKQLKPELTVSDRMLATGPGEQFAFALQVSTICAFAFGAPVLLWQMWGFIAAGLYANERRAVLKYFPLSLGLFLTGVLFGYFVMLPWTFYFLAKTYSPEKVQFLPSLDSYLTLLQSLTLILGGVFQLPIVMYALMRVGIVERATFVKYRRHFIVATFVIAGILTPPDPYTQSMMALPMLALYEAALLWARFTMKPKKAEGAK
jgi:sec-independent protein translocase protein TatC